MKTRRAMWSKGTSLRADLAKAPITKSAASWQLAVHSLENEVEEMRYYPVNLDLRDRCVLIVGGGAVAEGKATQLVAAGAHVRIVSPTLTVGLSELVDQGVIAYRADLFAESDLDGVALVISATDDQEVNETVAMAAARRGLLCNVVDQPALCNFITPALVVRGDLQISISTGGGSPALAQRVKREVAERIGEEYGELLELAAEMRAEARRRTPDFEQRRALLHAFVESAALDLLRAGRRAEAQRLARELLAAAETSAAEKGRMRTTHDIEQATYGI
jgi:siroheme synthase-like protein